MAMTDLTDEQCIEAVNAFKEAGTKAEAARLLGIARSTFNSRYDRACARGFAGTMPVLSGYEIKKTSTQFGPDGEVQREWVQQQPARSDEPFEMPDGHVIKGVSALMDPAGRVIQQWVKTREDKHVDDLVDALKATFSDYKGKAKPAKPPKVANEDLATVYNIADHHLGLFAWGMETGEDYDLKIGERILRDAMADLVSNSPPSDTAVVLNLGDFFHSDTSENRTVASGHALDVDTRYAKVLQVGVRLLVDCIELALRKHRKVKVRCLPGNHDPHTALTLSVALSSFFESEPRVDVDCDPSKFFWWRFGKVFIGATHGDEVKPDAMPGVMASTRAKEWGETEFRYAYFGHVHHKSRGGGEAHGVIWETFQSLAAKDAWHAGRGYSSGRSMTAITHHKDKGEVFRHTVSVPGGQK